MIITSVFARKYSDLATSQTKFDSVVERNVIRCKDHEPLYCQFFSSCIVYLLAEFLRRNITADQNKRRLLCFDDSILHRGLNTFGCSPVADPSDRLHPHHRLCRPHLLLPAKRCAITDYVRGTTCVHIGFVAPDKKLSFIFPPRFNYLFSSYPNTRGLYHYIIAANSPKH
jgi:hypothetical protein